MGVPVLLLAWVCTGIQWYCVLYQPMVCGRPLLVHSGWECLCSCWHGCVLVYSGTVYCINQWCVADPCSCIVDGSACALVGMGVYWYTVVLCIVSTNGVWPTLARA